MMTAILGPPWLDEATFALELQSVGNARRFVRERLESHHLPLMVDDVTLVASELATNAVRHAGTPFTVTLTALADAVVLTVRDGSTTSPIRVDAQMDDAAGRGVAIVEALSRDWGVVVDANCGKSVWAAFEYREA